MHTHKGIVLERRLVAARDCFGGIWGILGGMMKRF
jgi:hypothetical protein